MRSAFASAPARLVLALTTLAVGVALVLAVHAQGAEQAWVAYFAPGAACAGADDRNATAGTQRRAVRCLVNWARAQEHRPLLRPSRALHRAAALKGRGVASCGQLSHTPCSTGVTDAVRQAGYRFSTFGENLFAGVEHHVSARDVVEAWLRSPPHRANILRPGYKELGLAGVPARGLVGSGESVVWVAAFAAPR